MEKAMPEFKVVEKFVSINGEGKRAGQLALFIRFKGCNLNCSYCDTLWAKEKECEYEDMNEDEILAYAINSGVNNITLTGGEPLLQSEIEVLLDKLSSEKRFNIEIETNGSISLEKYIKYDNISFTMDYKLLTSGMTEFMNLLNFELLRKNDTVKFVSGSMEDLTRAKEIIERYGLTKKCSIYISPVFGKIEPSKIVDFMIENNLNDVFLQLQLHKFIWDPSLRGV